MAAFTFVMSVILIIIAAIVWAFCLIGVNPLIDIHNGYVANGQVSVQSHHAAVWSLTFLTSVPGITIIGIVTANIVRAIEVSQAGSFW